MLPINSKTSRKKVAAELVVNEITKRVWGETKNPQKSGKILHFPK